MIRAGIIEIHGALDESQPNHASVKIQIALWIAGNRGDVMKSGNFDLHKARVLLRLSFSRLCRSDHLAGMAQAHRCAATLRSHRKRMLELFDGFLGMI